MAQSRLEKKDQVAYSYIDEVDFKPGFILQTVLRALHKSDFPPEKIRCIVADCQYGEGYHLDKFTCASIKRVIVEKFQAQLFVACENKEAFDQVLKVNESVLEEFGEKIKISSKIDYVVSDHYRKISEAIDKYYDAHPDEKASFEKKVCDEAKMYVARKYYQEQRALGNKIEEPSNRAEHDKKRDDIWKLASEAEKSHSLNHVKTEAKMVVAWAIENPDLVTVVLADSFTSAMGMAVSHAASMNIGFNKRAVILMPAEKKVGKQSPYVRGTLPTTVERVLDFEVKEVIQTYLSNQEPSKAASFIVTLNELLHEKKKASPTATPLSSSPPSSDTEWETQSPRVQSSLPSISTTSAPRLYQPREKSHSGNVVPLQQDQIKQKAPNKI